MKVVVITILISVLTGLGLLRVAWAKDTVTIPVYEATPGPWPSASPEPSPTPLVFHYGTNSNWTCLDDLAGTITCYPPNYPQVHLGSPSPRT